jgi:TolA-binding protein
LNLRPPGYEPGELPDCSTPRRGGKDSIFPVPWWVLIAVAAFAFVLVAGAVFAAAVLARLKRLQAAGDAIAAQAEEVARRSEELDRRLAHASARAEQAKGHLDRLNGSVEQLSVLSWALGDARKGITRLREAYLRK